MDIKKQAEDSLLSKKSSKLVGGILGYADVPSHGV